MRPEEAGPRVLEAPLDAVPPPPAVFRCAPGGRRGVRLENRLVMAPHGGVYESALPHAGQGARRRHGGHRDGEQSGPRKAGTRKTYDLMRNDAAEKPVSIQLFGADPTQMGEAAAMVEEAGADIVDLNCGCPVKKITKNQAGSSLLRYPERAYEIVSAMGARGAHPGDGEDAHRLGHRRAKPGGGFRKGGGGCGCEGHHRDTAGPRQAMFSGAVDLEAIARG